MYTIMSSASLSSMQSYIYICVCVCVYVCVCIVYINVVMFSSVYDYLLHLDHFLLLHQSLFL